MDFLKMEQKFNFLYGEKPFWSLKYAAEVLCEPNKTTAIYTLEDGLKITSVTTKYGDAYEWVNWFENTSDGNSQIISELYDCLIDLPMNKALPSSPCAYQPEFEDVTAIYSPKGSNWSYDEFSCDADRKQVNTFLGHIKLGQTKNYASAGGRSSNGTAPFFNIHNGGSGYICAVGWTGQWNCSITRNEDSVTVKSKIEDTNFRLYPGEKFRTSSIVIMPYNNCDFIESQNMWRRLVRQHFSLIGKEGREKHCPACLNFWGGMKTSSILERLEIVKENKLPYEYIWMDAGWCGGDTKPTPDEFEGDWAKHTGDWQISPLIHPNGLKDVAEVIHSMGMKFILWFEPERVLPHLPIAQEHPEYFLSIPTNGNLLLNLGDKEVWDYCFNTISNLIEEIGVDGYRQDFNISPINFWRQNDTEDRKGITEIKHINGLYAFWDALLLRFPNLLIDNCASGGRRIDIETLRRSVPLWRSDYQCPANFPTEGAQCHHLSYNLWLPYSGTGAGRDYDTYRMRSAYSPGIATNYMYSEHIVFDGDMNKIKWIKERLNEFIRLRDIMEGDFYPLTQVTDRTDVWSAAQFNCKDRGEGAVQVFRRQESPYETAGFKLYAIDESSNYCFEDADDNITFTLSGKELLENGFKITINDKRTAKLYFYKKL